MKFHDNRKYIAGKIKILRIIDIGLFFGMENS